MMNPLSDSTAATTTTATPRMIQAASPSETVPAADSDQSSVLFQKPKLSSTLLPEDFIVAEILVRLSLKPLFVFKCVSKRYKSIISSPKFAQNFLQRAHSWRESWATTGLSSLLLLPPLPTSFPSFTKTVMESVCVSFSRYGYGHDRRDVICSSNGLILSGFRLSEVFPFDLYVSNPLTKNSVKLPSLGDFRCPRMEYGIVTRRCLDHQDASSSSFLTYKAVAFKPRVPTHGNATQKYDVMIFSSDTGSWSGPWVLSRPAVLDRRRSSYKDFSRGFSHNGIYHWFDNHTGNVLTYDPFNTPNRLGYIRSPSRYGPHPHSNLINSGDYEKLKYFEFVPNDGQSRAGRVSVWQLVDSDKGEWSLEHEFMVTKSYRFPSLLVAPIPYNRDLIFSPVLQSWCLGVINFQDGGRPEFVELVVEPAEHENVPHRLNTEELTLVPVETCPWSSP